MEQHYFKYSPHPVKTAKIDANTSYQNPHILLDENYLAALSGYFDENTM